MPAVTMTWEKFARTVLPRALGMELFIPAGTGNYAALVTAANADAPPILQWDLPGTRNPLSWYVYSGGSTPERWGLTAGQYHEITGICLQPSMWGDADKFAHQGASVFLLLAGAKDSHAGSAGAGLFPQLLKSEYHAIRATIEAYSQGARIGGLEESSACGLKLEKGAEWNHMVRVETADARLDYRLDRWD
jgi:hypothetical protein